VIRLGHAWVLLSTVFVWLRLPSRVVALSGEGKRDARLSGVVFHGTSDVVLQARVRRRRINISLHTADYDTMYTNARSERCNCRDYIITLSKAEFDAVRGGYSATAPSRPAGAGVTCVSSYHIPGSTTTVPLMAFMA